MEHSALIRDRSEAGRFVQIAALRNERQVIMTLLFGDKWGERRLPAVRQPLSPVAILHAAE
jgi:hypothetical protein